MMTEFLSPLAGNLALQTFLVVAGTLLAVGVAVRVFKAASQEKKLKKFLKDFKGPPGKWFIGNMDAVGDIDDATYTRFLNFAHTYGAAFKMNYINVHVLNLTTPEYMAVVYKSSAPKHDNVYRFLRQWIGDGILVSMGAKWFRNRRLLTPAFHFDILKPYTEVFSDTAKVMIAKWHQLCKPCADIEMFEQISLMTLDSLLKTAFSTETNVQHIGTQHPYIKSVYEITDLLIRRFQSLSKRNDFIYYNLTKSGYKMKKYLKQARDFTNGIVQNRKQKRESGADQQQKKYLDFLDMLLDARDEDGVGLTDAEIMDEVDTFMFEGHDTTASALSWFFYNMACHQDHQERCREEVLEVLGERQEVQWSDLSKFEYLTMCMKESLRIHPPVPATHRTLDEDLVLPDGRVAPKGINVNLAIYICHHNPAVWENPEEFDPLRFSPENSQNRHSHAFIPFAAGPRNCIGQHFAMNELKVVAALVLRNFQLNADPNRKPMLNARLVLRSKNGVWLKVTAL